MHEIYLETGQRGGYVTPMVFESYQTHTAEVCINEFTFQNKKKGGSLIEDINPFIPEEETEKLTKVSLSSTRTKLKGSISLQTLVQRAFRRK